MLVTVGEIVDNVYELLQDSDHERYDVGSVYQALNEGLLEAQRLRPDFWRGTDAPQYSQGDVDVVIDFPGPYKPALANYTAGRVLLRDREDSTDARAVIFLNNFTAKLTTLVA